MMKKEFQAFWKEVFASLDLKECSTIIIFSYSALLFLGALFIIAAVSIFARTIADLISATETSNVSK